MKYHQIQFTIKKSGEIIEEVLGTAEDNSCLSITKVFEDTLGKVKDREMKEQMESIYDFDSNFDNNNVKIG